VRRFAPVQVSPHRLVSNYQGSFIPTVSNNAALLLDQSRIKAAKTINNYGNYDWIDSPININVHFLARAENSGALESNYPA